jgi:hypothetical protein
MSLTAKKAMMTVRVMDYDVFERTRGYLVSRHLLWVEAVLDQHVVRGYTKFRVIGVVRADFRVPIRFHMVEIIDNNILVIGCKFILWRGP